METDTGKEIIISPPDYKEAINSESEFYVQFYNFIPDVEAIIIKIVHRYLEKYDILYIKDTVMAVIKEMINNAVKANVKRLYFKIKNLNIANPEEYRTGMETFKADTYQSDNTEYLDKLYDSKLVVRASFKATDEHIHINIINNIPILDTELAKINSRIKKAFKYNDISEAFDDVLDDSEGAGLGLIMAMMLLKNSGLPPDSYRVYSKGNLTISAVSIPKNLTKQESKAQITDAIIKEIEDLPSFPENIREIQKLCNTEDASIRVIAENISRDPGLTTAILKLANSAGYITIRKVDSLEDAVKIIGMKGLGTLLLASGVHKVMDSRYKRFESIWRDSYKRAFYAQRLSIQLKKSKLAEFAYLSGLLADIGRIVMLSINPELLLKLKDIAGLKGIEDPILLEEMSLGISHSTLGAMICKKWNFNRALLQTVEYHHRPHMAPEDIKILVYIVYLADAYVEIENKKFRFEIADEDVLEFFNLSQPETFQQIHQGLKDDYTAQSAPEKK